MHSKQTFRTKINGTPSNVMCYGHCKFCVNENFMGKQKKVKHLKKYYLENKIHTFQLIINDKFIVNIVLTKGCMHIHSKEYIKLFYKRIVNIYLVLHFFIYIFGIKYFASCYLKYT
jgi:hypothetical protein